MLLSRLVREFGDWGCTIEVPKDILELTKEQLKRSDYLNYFSDEDLYKLPIDNGSHFWYFFIKYGLGFHFSGERYFKLRRKISNSPFKNNLKNILMTPKYWHLLHSSSVRRGSLNRRTIN